MIYRFFMMVGIAGLLYQIVGNTLPVNKAMLLVGACCGITYALLGKEK